MDQPERSGWVAVRCIFRSWHEAVQVYEERVTLWRVNDFDAAIELAEQEAQDYADAVSGPAGDQTEFIGFSQAYLLAERLRTSAWKSGDAGYEAKSTAIESASIQTGSGNRMAVTRWAAG